MQWIPELQGQQTGMLCIGPPVFSHAPDCPKDCNELPASSPSGIYIIQPTGLQTIVVYYEMNREDGGWTVIQRSHRDTPVGWDESWSTYNHSFGNVHTEFWLGTEYTHQITRQKVYKHEICWTRNEGAVMFMKASLMYFSVSHKTDVIPED
ncbi:unnamed protein product [Coccothraustes coccothraustes]